MPFLTASPHSKSIVNSQLRFKLKSSSAILLALGLTTLSACSTPKSLSPVAGNHASSHSTNTLSAEVIVDEMVANNIAIDEAIIDEMIPPAPNSRLDLIAIDKVMSQYFTECSEAFAQQHKPFIQASLAQQYFGDDNQVVDFINTDFTHESLACEFGALEFTSVISQQKRQSAKQVLDASADQQKQALAQRYIDNVQLDLFDIYVRQGVIAEGDKALAFGRDANLLWSEWAIVPIDFSSKQKGVSTIESLEIMKQAVSRLTQYLQTHQDMLAQRPQKRALIIDQALIYIIQLNEQYAESERQIDTYSQSKAWRTEVIADDIQQIMGTPSSQAQIDTIIASMIAKVEQKQNETMAQFFELIRMRYEDFNQAKMLESAKAFILQNVDAKPLSELLVAMDYAKLEDITSSERWLDKVAQHSNLMRNLCAPDAKSKYFASNQALLSSPKSEWFKSQLLARCP